MPEFEPLTSEDRQLIGEPEPPPPAPHARRWPWRVGIAAAVLLAAFAMIISRSQDSPDTAAPDADITATGALPSHSAERGPRLPHVDSPVRLTLGAVSLDLPGELVSFDVAPDGHTAVVATNCVPLSRCRAYLGVSRDGQRWVRRRLPREVTAEAVTVWSLGGGVLVIEEPWSLRLRSGDGGRTWERAPLKLGAPVSDGSAGTLALTAGARPQRAPCDGQAVAVVRRDTGRTAPLRSQPPDMNVCAVMADGADDVWAAGIDPVTHQPLAARSGDRGRGWSVSPLPDFHAEAEQVWLSIAGRDVYATVFGPLQASPRSDGVIAVFQRARDGWVRTVRYTGPTGEINGMITCPRGMLLAVQRGTGMFTRPRQLVSYDHGRSWAVAESAVLVTGSSATTQRADADRYAWAYTPLGRQGLARSTDCRTWRGLPVR